MGHFLLDVARAQFALSALLAKVVEAGGVEPLASQQGAEFSGSVAGVGFLENAQFVGGGEASSCGLLVDLGVRDGILALERRNRERLCWSLSVAMRRFDNECVHEK